jgi:hypothetical protein
MTYVATDVRATNPGLPKPATIAMAFWALGLAAVAALGEKRKRGAGKPSRLLRHFDNLILL